MTQIFDSTEYKEYLEIALEATGRTVKGVRTRFAEAVGCRPGYITQIISGPAHLSLEQADLASVFLNHTEEESEYLLLLVILARAGTERLRKKIEAQVHRKQAERHNLKSRFKVKSLSGEQQLTFYSHWHYLAVLTTLSVPSFQTKESLSEKLNLPLKKITAIVDFLEQTELVVRQKNRFVPGVQRTHLGKDSVMLPKHHLNWRLQAMQSIENVKEGDLHYSSVIGISKKDVHRVRERIIQALEDIATIIEPSKEECIYSLCIDYFNLLKS